MENPSTTILYHIIITPTLNIFLKTLLILQKDTKVGSQNLVLYQTVDVESLDEPVLVLWALLSVYEQVGKYSTYLIRLLWIYPGAHWKSVVLSEMSRVTWQQWHCWVRSIMVINQNEFHLWLTYDDCMTVCLAGYFRLVWFRLWYGWVIISKFSVQCSCSSMP